MKFNYSLTGQTSLALGFEVWIINNTGDSGILCATAPKSGTNLLSFTCQNSPLIGRYLNITRTRNYKENYLVLCEVVVWGTIATYIPTGNYFFNLISYLNMRCLSYKVNLISVS